MAHKEQLEAVEKLVQEEPGLMYVDSVLEFGSRNINGSVRNLFYLVGTYVSVDCVAGDGVDTVCLAHEYKSEEKFDVGICCEMLEHDPHWKLTLINLCHHVVSGGTILITCATGNRPRHGTLDSDGEVFGPSSLYYRNLQACDILGMIESRCSEVILRWNKDQTDLYLKAKLK
jgi:hypothetical protein